MRAGVSVVVTAGDLSLYLSTSPPEGHCGGWERILDIVFGLVRVIIFWPTLLV